MINDKPKDDRALRQVLVEIALKQAEILDDVMMGIINTYPDGNMCCAHPKSGAKQMRCRLDAFRRGIKMIK